MAIGTGTVSHPVIWQCWKGSRRADTPAAPQPKPIPKRDAVNFWHQARELERRTRSPGCQDGQIGRNGLALLHAFIFDFQNWKTGQCDPSYESLAKAAAISVRSVARGLQKLAAIKINGQPILTWTKRCIGEETAVGWRLKQISNLYEITLKALVWPMPEPEPGTWGDHPNRGAEAFVETPTDAVRAWEGDRGLDGALARLAAEFLKKI